MTQLYQPPLLLGAVAFIAGVVVGLSGAPEWAMACAALSAAILGALCAWRIAPNSRLRRTTAILALATPLVFGLGVWRAETAQWRETDLARADLSGQPVEIHGEVVGDPVLRGTRIATHVRTETIRLGGELRHVTDRVQLSLPGDARIQRGDRVQVTVTLTPTAGDVDDGYRSWLQAQGVAALGTVAASDLVVVERAGSSWWRTAAQTTRGAVNDALRDVLPPPLSGLAQGIVTGQQAAIDGRLRDDLNTTSLSHLIVVSGSNLTLLTAIVISGTSWLLGRRTAAGLAILVALGYAAFSGGDPPVLRALGMALVFATAHLLGRGAAAIDAIAIAAAVMVAIEPQILRDVSFQLTLAGTLGLVLLMPSLTQRQVAGVAGLGGAIRAVALVSLIAMLATMPLIALHFQRVSLVGLAANVVVAPLFAWMFLGSFTVGVIGVVSATVAELVSWPLAWLPLRWLALAAESGAQIPGAAQSVREFAPLHAAVIYTAILAAAVRPRREVVARWDRTDLDRVDLQRTQAMPGRLKALLATTVLALLALTLWLTVLMRDDELAVHFIDVGQGDAALIVTPDRQTILIDTGAHADSLLAALRAHLPSGTKQIDLVVITHPQADHAEAMWALLDQYDVTRLAVSPYLGQTDFGRRLIVHARIHSAPLSFVQAGTQIAFEGREHTLLLDVLWPVTSGALVEAARNDPNTTGVVLRMRYGEAALLFAADIGAEQELELTRLPCPPAGEPCLLRADVLKVAHHGSRYSTTRILLDRVQPSLAVISVGAVNRHGHPHPEVIETLVESDVAVATTAERGTVSLSTDGQSILWSAQR